MKAKREGMGTYRVEYTITLTVEDGRELSFPKERFLTEDEISDVKENPGLSGTGVPGYRANKFSPYHEVAARKGDHRHDPGGE
ncbi:MAG: hypothetical protein ACE1ZE_02090 [Candidatus Binatia bacterium]